MGGTKKIKRQLLADAFFLGFITIGTQIILIREFLLVYSNNELVIGFILAAWMMFTALGAGTFKFFRIKSFKCSFIRILFIFLSFYPLLAALLIETLRNVLFEPGRMLSLWEIITFSSLILFPLCFAGGFLFTLINSFKKQKITAKKLYSFEALGSMTGGFLVSIYFICNLQINNFTCLEYLLLIILIYLIIHDYRQFNYKAASLFIFIFFGITTLFLHVNINTVAKEKLYRGQKILDTKETFQGNITVSKSGNQINFFENNIFLFSTDDIIQKEEDIHYALLQRPKATDILVAGGGETGILNEILKYPDIKNIDNTELNSYLIKLAKKYSSIPDTSIVHIIIKDPAIFIKKTNYKYDAVFINQPSPANASLNRFFTIEFYKQVKQVLNKNGILSTRLPYSQNYQDADQLNMLAAVYNSLKHNFKNILLIPGNKLYLLASDSSLNFEYKSKIETLNIHNSYVNTAYINDILLKFKSEQILNNIKDITLVNHDFKPVVYFRVLKHWLGFFKENIYYLIFSGLLLILIILVFTKGLSKAIFTSGFSAASAEIVLLISFQIITGEIYLLLGILITVFMAGLAVGSATAKKSKEKKASAITFKVQLISILLFITTAIFLKNSYSELSSLLINLFIFFIIFTIATLTGYQYGVVVEADNKAVAKAYSADLSGAAIGSFIPVIFLIPEYGIINTLYILAAFHLITLLLVINANRKKSL